MNENKPLSYFETLKNNPNAIMISIESLFNEPLNDEAKFLYLNIIEINLANMYKEKNMNMNDIMENFLFKWMEFLILNINNKARPNSIDLDDNDQIEKIYNLNKFAQIFSTMVVNENLSLSSKLLKTLFNFINPYISISPTYLHAKVISHEGIRYAIEVKYIIDLYLRILKALHMEIADRSISMTQNEIQRNAIVKDDIREKSAAFLINSLFQIIILYEDILPSVCTSAFEVLGLYASWVDINLVANAAFLQIILTLMGRGNGESDDVKGKRELTGAAIDALVDIVNKKMEAWPKAEFLETIYKAIDGFEPRACGKLLHVSPDEKGQSEGDRDVYLIVKKGKLVSTFGTLIIASWDKLLKTSMEDKKSAIFYMIVSKYDLMLQYLNYPNVKVSASLLPFANDFINVLIKKAPQVYKDAFKVKLQEILEACIKNLRLPPSSNLDIMVEENLHNSIQDSRKDFKALFENIATIV